MAANAVKYGWEEPGKVEFSGYTESGKWGIFKTWDGTINVTCLPVFEGMRERVDKVLQRASAKILNVVF
jgi:hypothetical protein